MSGYIVFKDAVRVGKYGKIAVLIRFFASNEPLKKINLHISFLNQFCDSFFSCDHQNYAKYLTVYMLTLFNLKDSYLDSKNLCELSQKCLHLGMLLTLR